MIIILSCFISNYVIIMFENTKYNTMLSKCKCKKLTCCFYTNIVLYNNIILDSNKKNRYNF